MLQVDEIHVLRDASEQLLAPVVAYLLQDLARRVAEAGQLTATAQYEFWKLQELGISQRKTKKALKRLLNVSNRQLRQMLTQSAEAGYRHDLEALPYQQAVPFRENQPVQKIVKAALEQTQGELKNLTQTLGMVDPYGNALPLQDAYRSCMDYAYSQVATGATDYNTAIRQATRNLAEKGVRVIDYESGVHTTLEAATRRCVMGGLGLMQEQISKQNHDDMGANGWEIDAHSNSAPDHEPIQGRQYGDAEYDALNASLVRRIGTLNCGHCAHPILLGISRPQYTPEELEEMRQENEAGFTYNGKHYTGYEATQRQRALERAIRKQRRRILVDEASGDAQRLQDDQIRLVRLEEEYRRFSKAAGLRTQQERLEVVGYNWKQASAAEKVFKNSFTSAETQSTINTQRGELVTISNIESPIEQRHTGKGNPNAILHFDVELNNRQQRILDALPNPDSRITLQKGDVNMTDLSALTAKTGHEFALFTRNGERLIVRGNDNMVAITPEEAHSMGIDGYIWSGHTHPGTGFNVLQPSAGDYAILNQFDQENSAIYNSAGQYLIFERTEPYV